MSLFKRGYKSVREEKTRQEEEAKRRQMGLFRLFLREDGEEAEIRFLTEEPINYYEHTIPNGRLFDNIPCIGADCPHCADDDKPRFVGAFLILDKREYEYTDRQTGKKKTAKNQLRLYVQGTKVLSQLDRLSEKYGLTTHEYTLVRTGKGKNDTSYTFERGDKVGVMTRKEIEAILPERLREQYDGSMDSLYAIIEAQINMLAGIAEEKEPVESKATKVVNVADEEDLLLWEKEEVKEEKPVRKGLKSMMKK